MVCLNLEVVFQFYLDFVWNPLILIKNQLRPCPCRARWSTWNWISRSWAPNIQVVFVNVAMQFLLWRCSNVGPLYDIYWYWKIWVGQVYGPALPAFVKLTPTTLLHKLSFIFLIEEKHHYTVFGWKSHILPRNNLMSAFLRHCLIGPIGAAHLQALGPDLVPQRWTYLKMISHNLKSQRILHRFPNWEHGWNIVVAFLVDRQLPRGLLSLDLVLLRCGIGVRGAKVLWQLGWAVGFDQHIATKRWVLQ